MSYWDTSTLAKLYLPEPDSASFSRKAAIDPIVVTSRLALYEMRRVAFRKEGEGLIQAGTAESAPGQMNQDIATGQIRLIELDARVESEFNSIMALCYRRNQPLLIRTLDALHLASARVAGETQLVTTDKRMRVAATVLGLSLFPA